MSIFITTMELARSSIKVSRCLSYWCIHLPPTNTSKPYVLFLHGLPSLPTDFHLQISHLSTLGYGILAPQLLGYGDTSHPAESDAYRLKEMAGDLVDILDHYSIQEVVGVGHDWGVTLLTRLEFYYPSRIMKMVLLTIACAPMAQPFDLDAVNAMTKEHLGYEGYGYIDFLARDRKAADIINTHQDSFRSLIFCQDPDLWEEHFGTVGGLRQWLVDDRKAHAIVKYNNDIREAHEEAFSLSKGGYCGTLNWYINHVSNTNIPDEASELKTRGLKVYQTTKPVLQILAGRDRIAIAPMQQQMTEAYATNARIVTLDTGHWVMLEAAEEVNRELEQFVQTRA